MENQIENWIALYGYAAIFGLLVLGIVGLPVPDETLLTFTGYLVFRGRLRLPLAYGAALAGSLCGITLSYLLGRTFGLGLIHRFGRYVHITEARIRKAHAWFERVGHWGLTFGYFIPGVRHLTAYAAGMSEVGAKQFAFFAYLGGAMWVASFVALGYFLGEQWREVQRVVDRYLLWLAVGASIALVAFLIWRWRRPKHT